MHTETIYYKSALVLTGKLYNVKTSDSMTIMGTGKCMS